MIYNFMDKLFDCALFNFLPYGSARARLISKQFLSGCDCKDATVAGTYIFIAALTAELLGSSVGGQVCCARDA